jgi:hypothetical protein
VSDPALIAESVAEDVYPDFTVIECAFQRTYGPVEYDYFVKIAGQWIAVGAEDYGDDTWVDVTSRYLSVTVAAVPSAHSDGSDG